MDQTDILHQIVEAERGAQKLFEEASRQQEELSEYLKTETQKMFEHERTKADALLNRYETEEHTRSEREIHLLDEKLEKDLDGLTSLFFEKKEQWADQLFDRVVGGR